MLISSSAFSDSGEIPAKFTCDGENINPPLTIHEVPPDAKSLVLVVDDPDAPSGTFVHWLIWNLPPETEILGERYVSKDAVEGRTSFGKSGWGGPCPPSGSHRYFFHIFALDKVLDLTTSADFASLEKEINGHVLVKADLVGRYKRV